MSQATWCRLCVNICHDYIGLYDESERCNMDLYEIAVKYFHPMFLALINGGELTVVCLDCWRHIFEFNNFQKAIIAAQTKLLKNRPKEKAVNPEVAHEAEEAFVGLNNGSGMCNDDFVKEEFELMDARNDISAHRMDHSMNSPSHTDEEVPLRDVFEDDDLSSCHDSDSPLEEYDDPVGVFTGGEFNTGGDNLLPAMSHLGLDEAISQSTKLNNNTIVSLEDNVKSKSNKSVTSKTKKKRSTQELDDCIAKWRTTLDCPICGGQFPDVGCLGGHFRSTHDSDKCYIVCCQLKFFNRSKIAEHARFHLDPHANKCELCGKIFDLTSHLRRHQAKVHSDSQCNGPISNRKTQKELDDIIAKWKPHLECVVCEVSHPTFTMLRRHFRLQHPNHRFYVECCQEKLEQRCVTADHMQFHMDPNAFKCEVCDIQYTNSGSLSGHMYSRHYKVVQPCRELPEVRSAT